MQQKYRKSVGTICSKNIRKASIAAGQNVRNSILAAIFLTHLTYLTCDITASTRFTVPADAGGAFNMRCQCLQVLLFSAFVGRTLSSLVCPVLDPVQECDDLTTRTRCFISESTVRETFGNLQTYAPEYCGAVSRSD